LLYAKKLK
jgi:hypothetical protein